MNSKPVEQHLAAQLNKLNEDDRSRLAKHP